MTVQQVLDQLRSTPLQLRELTAGVAAELLRTPPDPDEWSANDVLAHLRACSDRWGEAATRIVEEDDPRLRATNPRIWILVMACTPLTVSGRDQRLAGECRRGDRPAIGQQGSGVVEHDDSVTQERPTLLVMRCDRDCCAAVRTVGARTERLV